MLFEHLTRPFGYLAIKEVRGKELYDWFYPAFLTLLTFGLFYLSGKTHSELNDGMINGLVWFVSNLPGFYIAALAAIATFQSPMLEQYLETSSSTTPYIQYDVVDERKKKVSKTFKLKRRAFLCYMFAFLTALSFIIVTLNKLSTLIPNTDGTIFMMYCWSILFLFFQMVVTTFSGLYYLGSRLNEKGSL